jgi:molecular chaperone DnaK
MGGAGGMGDMGGAGPGGAAGEGDDEYVDADFEDVDDDES